MKHILIILTLGILGTGLYWVASSGHSNSVSTASSEPAATAQPTTEQQETPGAEKRPTTGPTQTAAADTNPDTSSVQTSDDNSNSASSETPSRLNRYQRVLSASEESNTPGINTPSSSAPVGEAKPNARLQSYQTTLNLLSE